MRSKLLRRMLAFGMVLFLLSGTLYDTKVLGASMQYVLKDQVSGETTGKLNNDSSDAYLQQIKQLAEGELTKEKEEKIADLKEKYLNSGPKYGYDYSISNSFLQTVAASNGKFTIGTVEGNPNYSTDNNKKLLYGHPSPRTSETMITIDGEEYWFEADSVMKQTESNSIIASMTIRDLGILVTEKLSFYTNKATGRDDTVKIAYNVVNTSTTTHSVGVRIMLDTMLADHDDAPFKIAGYGNITKAKVLSGNAITQVYQVYDDLDAPTTMAMGTLWLGNDRHPDKVQYCNWAGIDDSEWAHRVDDGDLLGDSAVGIYFNPVSLPTGKSTDVCTYYGTGIGLTGSGDSSTPVDDLIDKDEFDLYVTDSRTGAAISEATVEIEGIGSETTDEKGAARFASVASDKNGKTLNLSVRHADYQDKDTSVQVELGSCKTIQMKKHGDTQPMLNSVTMTSANSKYNNIDLLSSTVYFNSNPSNVAATSSNTQLIDIRAVCDMDDCVYQLISDGKVVRENDTGEFVLKSLTGNNSGKTYTTNRLCDFSEGKNIYLRAISKEGNQSQDNLLGIKVSAPSSYTTNLKSSLPFTQSFDLSGIEDAADILGILLGEDALDKPFGIGDMPLEAEIDENGKIKVTYNKPVVQSIDDFRADYAKQVLNRAGALKNFGGSTGRLGIGNLGVDVNLAGYGEGYMEDGACHINLGIVGTVSGGASYTTTFFLGWIPLYIEVGAEAEANFEVAASVVNENGLSMRITEGKFEPSISLYAELGVGASGVLSAGLQGRGTLTYLADFLRDYYSLKLKASASIEVHAFLYSNSLEIAQHTWTLYDSNQSGQNGNHKASSFNMYDTDSFKMSSRSYQSMGRATSSQSELNSGVYTNAKPVMVKVNDTYYRFWLHDIATRTSVNRTAVVYSKYDSEEEEWTEPTILADNGTADFDFNVAVSGNDIYIAYQEAKRVLSDSDYADLKAEGSTAGLKQMISESQISMVKLDTSDDRISDVGVISDSNTIGALSPRVSVDGTNVTVVWYQNSENNIFGAENGSDDIGENTIYYRNITMGDTPEKGQIKSFSVGESTITSIDAGMLNGSQQIAYVVDTDNKLSTIEDRELYLASGLSGTLVHNKITKTATQSELDASPYFAKIAGVNSLIWYEGGNFYYTSTDAVGKKAVFDSSNIPMTTNNGYTVLEDGNDTAIVWTSTSSDSVGEDRYVSLYGTKLQNGTWGTPYEIEKLSDIENPWISSVSGFLENGLCMVSYAMTKYEDGELVCSSLCSAKEESTSQVILTDLDYDLNEAVADETLSVKVTLKNTGTVDVDQTDLYIGENSIQIPDMDLAPGEEKQYSVNVTLSDDPTNHEYAVSVGDDEDTFTIYANYTDLSVTEGKQLIAGNNRYRTFTIKNESKIDAENVNFKILLDNEENGAIAYDYSFEGAIKAGDSFTLLCNADLFGDSTVAYKRLTTSTDERMTENNKGVICVNGEIPDVVKESDLVIKSENTEEGTVASIEGFEAVTAGYQKKCNTNDAITITAEPKEGFAFTGWEIYGKGSVADLHGLTTTYYMGDADTVVTATFANERHMTCIDLPATHAMEEGDTYHLMPTIDPVDSSDHLTWSSVDSSIVAVDENGVITAKAVGETRIIAQSAENPEVKAACTVTVTQKLLESLRMVYPSLNVAGVGKEEDLRILKNPISSTEKVIYTSNHPEYVTVDQSGKIKSVAPGTSVITAKGQTSNKEATCTVTVTIPLENVYFAKPLINMVVNETKEVGYVLNPGNTTEIPASDDIIWTVSDSSIASITPSNDHRYVAIKAKKKGTVCIVVDINGGYSASFTVEIRQPITGVSLNKSQVRLEKGHSTYLSCTKSPYDADGSVSWSSSNSSVAGVYNGTVTGYKPGTAVITVTSDTGYKAHCTVTVYVDEVIVNSIADFQSSHPYDNSLDRTWIYKNPRATSLTATFNKECKVEKNYDKIYIYDGTNKLIGTYTDTELSGKVVKVPGNTIKVTLHSDSSRTYYGFKVDKVVPTYSYIDISKASVSVASCTYVGKQLLPKAVVKVNGVTLKQNVDYRMTYSNNVNVGTGIVNITGIGSYKGTVQGKFAILPATLGSNNISGIYNVAYTGKAIKIKPIVKMNGILLQLNRDYKLSYSNNKKVGKKAVVTITGLGNYKGTVNRKFTIVSNKYAITGKNSQIKIADTITYNGKARKPSITIKRNGKTFSSKNYSVVYTNNVKLGKATVTIYGKGKYAGKLTKTFIIVPGATSILKAKNSSSKSVVVTYKKLIGVSGYKIYYSTSKSGKYKQAGGTTKETYTIGKLKKGKTYYIKVRSYIKVGKKTYYGAYSKVSKVKVNK